MGRRAGLSTVLILGAIVLLVSIAIGNSMGNHVLGQISARAPDEIIPSPAATSTPDSGIPLQVLAQRQHSALSVATDPAFPDPRITPEPPVVATPRPVPKPTRSPSPAPASPPPDADNPSEDSTYTSPPLPIPIVSHEPGAISDPNGEPLPVPSPSAAGSPRPSPRPTPP